MYRRHEDPGSTSATLLGRAVADKQDDKWLTEFCSNYYGWMLWLASLNGLQQCDAEEIVQELIIYLKDYLPKFTYETEGSFRSFLRVAIHNRCSSFRGRKRSVAMIEPCEIAAPPELDPVEVAIEREMKARLDGAIGRVEAKWKRQGQGLFWKSVKMRFEGLRSKVVADRLGITELAVNSAVFRARREIENELNNSSLE